MKESERLTVYIAGYAHGYGFIGGTPPRRTKNVCRGKFDASFCVDRLAAYEETGLSPEEVEKLKHECEDKERAYNEEYQSRRILKAENAILVKRLDKRCDTFPTFERLKAENAALKKEKTLADEAIGNLFHNVAKLDRENAELRERLEKWREPFVEQDQTTGNWWVFHSRIEVFASANSDLFETREEAEARLKELGGKKNA